jgi:predicted Zn-ribbon and HTH transcriptional regulator
LICERCHAGQLLRYERTVGKEGASVTVTGVRCERCGYTQLDNDDDIWSAVGL